jgi:hypothetical protein
MLATILGSNLSRNGLLLCRVFEKKKIGHVLHRLGEREEEKRKVRENRLKCVIYVCTLTVIICRDPYP